MSFSNRFVLVFVQLRSELCDLTNEIQRVTIKEDNREVSAVMDLGTGVL